MDLDDTEVVMNQKILSHENANHIVDLQVQRVDNNNNNDSDREESLWQTSHITYPTDKTSTWKIKVKPPPELRGANMQFVVEVESIFNDGSGSTQDGATLVYPKMCDGRRSFARNYNEVATLEIAGNADSVEVWGAWAIGFGQVSLTPRLVLLKGEAEEEEEEL